ncbi:NIPSNAP family protein [Planococcus shixiaomingii]|uniref:NIPSNAP family protein n=1 Tax=Planococcus shixiaomingii TaxID=3058393 RepID=UPI00265B2DEB|nr:NIPSNAP family protein [Planococcus sp. N028]
MILFNKHFNRSLLPAQQKYGAHLIGRWMTNDAKDSVEVFAIWQYASMEEYQQIEQQVRNDREHMERVETGINLSAQERKLTTCF